MSANYIRNLVIWIRRNSASVIAKVIDDWNHLPKFLIESYASTVLTFKTKLELYNRFDYFWLATVIYYELVF